MPPAQTELDFDNRMRSEADDLEAEGLQLLRQLYPEGLPDDISPERAERIARTAAAMDGRVDVGEVPRRESDEALGNVRSFDE